MTTPPAHIEDQSQSDGQDVLYTARPSPVSAAIWVIFCGSLWFVLALNGAEGFLWGGVIVAPIAILVVLHHRAKEIVLTSRSVIYRHGIFGQKVDIIPIAQIDSIKTHWHAVEINSGSIFNKLALGISDASAFTNALEGARSRGRGNP